MTYTAPTRTPLTPDPYTQPADLHVSPKITRDDTYTQTYTTYTQQGPTRAGGSLYKTPACVPGHENTLTRALMTLTERGQRPPCGDPDDRHLWLSEDAADRALAAEWCTGCPITAACQAAAEANGEKFGVWGGRDRTPKSRKAS